MVSFSGFGLIKRTLRFVRNRRFCAKIASCCAINSNTAAARVQIIRWIAQMMLSQRINIIGNASKARDHCVLRAGRIELVGNVVIFKKIVALVLCADQQVPLPIEAAHMGAENLVKAEEVKSTSHALTSIAR